MSLILEALRKSEAERRLGQAPELLAPMPVLHAPAASPRRSPGRLVAAVSVLALGIAMAGWWMLGRSPVPPAHPLATAIPPVTVTQPLTAIPSPVPAEVSTATKAPPAPTASLIARPANHAGDGSESGIAAPLPSPRPSVPSSAVAAPTARTESVKPRIAAASELASATRQAAPIPSFAGSPPAPAEAASTTAAPPADAEPGLLPVTALPGSERAELPALKVTMHAYADDPARRFMIVDGQRVIEGGQLGDGVVLVRIRRDGAEIEVRGRHLLLPNP